MHVWGRRNFELCQLCQTLFSLSRQHLWQFSSILLRIFLFLFSFQNNKNPLSGRESTPLTVSINILARVYHNFLSRICETFSFYFWILPRSVLCLHRHHIFTSQKISPPLPNIWNNVTVWTEMSTLQSWRMTLSHKYRSHSIFLSPGSILNLSTSKWYFKNNLNSNTHTQI